MIPADIEALALADAAGALDPDEQRDLQQKLAAAKQAAALNQKALRSYSWLEKTELSLKGEVKNMATRRKVEDIVRKVQGVKGIDNQLVITG